MHQREFARSLALGLAFSLALGGALFAQPPTSGGPGDPLLGPSSGPPRVPNAPGVTVPPVALGQPVPVPATTPGVLPSPAEPALPVPAQGEPGREDKVTGPNGTALGLGEFSPFANPTVGHVPFRADYRVTWFPSEPVAHQPTDLGYVQHDFGVAFPVWQDHANEWSASANVRGEFFHTHAVLVDTLQGFPNELWNIRFGTTFRHQFDNGWIGGGGVSVGSASDRPFHGIDEMTAGVNAFLRIPSGEHNAWLFSLSYSPTSELAFPLPGVAYIYQPSEQLRVNIGLPFQVLYRPTDELTFDLSYMLLRTVHARASYRLANPVRVYIGYDWGNESYFLADRANSNERFFYYDMRLTGGVLFTLAKNFSVDVAAGYVFDRFYFEGKQYSDNSHDRVDVGDGPFLSVQGKLRW